MSEQSTDGQNQKPELVEKERLDAVLNDMHKYKNELKALKEQQTQRETQEMKQREDWKKLAELKEEEANKYKQESEKIKNSYLVEKKFSAVKEYASTLGLRKEALSDLEMLDLNDVAIETTSTGKINVLGADKFAERIKTLKPHWFTEKAPTVNTGSTRVIDPNGSVSVEDIIAAEKEAKKTGDKSKYNELVVKYKQQVRK